MIKTIKKSVFVLFIVSLMMNACTQPVKKNIGLQLWSVRDDMKKDAVETIRQIGQMGYTFVEAAGYKDGLFYGMKPMEFKQL